MNELEQVWARKLDEARAEAETAGRADVTEYLNLRQSNDLIRQTSVDWLFESLLGIAAEAVRNNVKITIETENQHRFQIGHSNLAGSLVNLRQGVRCLTVEAGWTRQPADGFMRGGALACARISHFGMSKSNAELLLVRVGDSPNWFAVNKDGRRDLFDSRDLQRHFSMFLGTI